MASCLLSLLFLFLLPLMSLMVSAEYAGCKIRITDRGLDMLKSETQKFVEEELSSITIPEMRGRERGIEYTINEVKIQELSLTHVNLQFTPDGLMFDVQDSSIALTFSRQIPLLFFTDRGNINAMAEGVNMKTSLNLIRDDEGRLKINGITCDARIEEITARFSGTLGKVYGLLFYFLKSRIHSFLSQQICPTLDHAALVHVNSMLNTIPVRTDVYHNIGIDYALIDDPVVTSRSLDMHFRGMFFDRQQPNDMLVNAAVDPVMTEYDRMVYLALSEYFFDSGMFACYKAGLFKKDITQDEMPENVQTMLRMGRKGSLSLQLAVNSNPKTTITTSEVTVLMTAIVQVMILPPGQPPIQLSSVTVEATFNGKVSLRGKHLSVHVDLQELKISPNTWSLQSVALSALQRFLKNKLQQSVVPRVNDYTEQGVDIPLPDGMGFVEEVVEYHNGFIVFGADLHLSKRLSEIIARKRQ